MRIYPNPVGKLPNSLKEASREILESSILLEAEIF